MRRRLGEWLRHDAGSLAATAVDFGLMVGAVEIMHLGPVAATVLGAFFGALTSFLLGRTWVFHRTDANPAGQAVRHAVVSAGSLVLNALGVQVLVFGLGIGYLVARIVVASVVANAWNYPLQKYFVFGRR